MAAIRAATDADIGALMDAGLSDRDAAQAAGLGLRTYQRRKAEAKLARHERFLAEVLPRLIVSPPGRPVS